MKTVFTGVLLALGLAAGPAFAQESGIKIGTLTCKSTGTTNAIVFSETAFNCVYEGANGGAREEYVGEVDKIGLDLSITNDVTMVWGVVAPSADRYAPGALAGNYYGAQAGAAVGVGAGAGVLVGGGEGSFTLQPITVSGIEGVGASVGIQQFELKTAG
jgi:Protein of unknown function (DUF992)